jgi:glyoxylase-like metal-dependent hydrolase (beta-lactamase superfamily II)
MNIFTIPGIDYDSNIYVVVGEKTTVIDTGTGFHSPVVIDSIRKKIQGHQIQQIFLTHEHYDHVGGVLDIVQESKQTAKIFAHKDIVSKLKEGKSSFAEMLGGVMPKLTVDVPLLGGQHVMIGDDMYEVLVTPGHSIGSLCFYGIKNKILFSGDTIFSHGGFGRYDFPGGDFRLLLKSIELLSTLDVKSLYPGHGSIVENHGKDHVVQALFSIRSLL